VEVGYTKGGVVLSAETEKYQVEMDQVNAPVKDFIVKQNGKCTFAAGEATLTNLKQALGYGTVTSGSTESTFGVSGADGIPTYYAVGFECYAPGASSSAAWYRRVIVWRGSPAGTVELKADKGEEMVVQHEFNALYDASQTSTERLWKVIDRVV
jgi:hypothetical protein